MEQTCDFVHAGPSSVATPATLNDSTPIRQAEVLQGFPSPRVIQFPGNRPRAAVRSDIHMKLKTLEDLLLHELKDLYSAEHQLLKALPKMAKAATNEDLKAGFEEHFEQTKGHAERLEQIAEILEKKLTGHKCKAMEGLIEEGSELISEDAEDAIRDAGLIGAAQRVEHYEIAGYGTARSIAQHLGHEDIAGLLEETLEEEKETDEKLTELAETALAAEIENAVNR